MIAPKQVAQGTGEGVGRGRPAAQAGGAVFPSRLATVGTTGRGEVAGFLQVAQAR